MAGFFDHLNVINYSKKADDVDIKDYNAFMVNRGLSQFQDTILYANEMNMRHHTDDQLQFDFLINSIRKRKRFSKWAKKQAGNDADVKLIIEAYGYSEPKARDALRMLSDEQLDVIRQRNYKGGKR